VSEPLEVPERAFVLVLGKGGQAFAAELFEPAELLDPEAALADERHTAVVERLRAGDSAVVCLTAPHVRVRDALLKIARKQSMPAVVFVLDPEGTERAAYEELARRRRVEAYYVTRSEGVDLRRIRPPCDRRELRGPFDIVGDLHGCADELEELLHVLGYARGESSTWSHPAGRTFVSVGDLADRGPRCVDVLETIMDMLEAGSALAVQGNHDDKLRRWLLGKKLKVSHGLRETIDEIEALDAESRARFTTRTLAVLGDLPTHLILDGGRLVVAHAGIREDYIGRTAGKVRSFTLYGDTTGEVDPYGLPVRRDWAAAYAGAATIVYGHTPRPTPEWVNGTVNVDQGCCFGGFLTALRYPEQRFVQVPAKAVHYPHSGDFQPHHGLSSE